MPKINDGAEEVAISRLKFHPRNANQGDLGAVMESVKINGFWGRVVVNRRTGNILAGNHRVMAARELGFENVPVEWVDVDDETELRILVADNRTTRLGIDDETRLSEILAELANTPAGLPGTGFDGDDLDRMSADLAGGGKFTETRPGDEIPDAPERVRRGDIWKMGDHLLWCGDSHRDWPVVFQETIGSGFTLFFDPPWEIQAAPPSGYGDALVFTDGQYFKQSVAMFGPPEWVFVWDCVASWYTPNRPLRRMKMALWYGSLEKYNPDGAHYGEPGKAHRATNTRGSYDYEPDPEGKHLSDVFALSLPKFHATGTHPHEKPVDWVRMLLANCTSGVVVDPYAGAGTSLIAAESIGRQSVAIEIDPKNCDVILARWEQVTGDSAVKLGSAE
jgi:hypothetical protein